MFKHFSSWQVVRPSAEVLGGYGQRSNGTGFFNVFLVHIYEGDCHYVTFVVE